MFPVGSSESSLRDELEVGRDIGKAVVWDALGLVFKVGSTPSGLFG